MISDTPDEGGGKAEGAKFKKGQIFVDVLYGWPQAPDRARRPTKVFKSKCE